jgi:dTDP-4-dehydrorhamnose 3,5-epimerase-like enzyme
MTKADLLPEYEKRVTTQTYGGKETIEGVVRIPVRYFVEDSGDFCEMVRMNGVGLEEVAGFEPKQVSYSYLQPGAIKAFHLHYKQTDVWFVPPRGQMLVGLHDAREHSKTVKNTMRFVLGAGKAELLVIPPGVLHGMANPWSDGSCVVYLTDEQFNVEDPDEQRLPWDTLGKDFWLPSKE